MSGRSSLNRSSTGCVLVCGGSSYVNRSVTGCVPVPGSCLPGPGYVGVGIFNANRSVTGFTGCVPAPGGGLRGLLDRQLVPGTFRVGPAQGRVRLLSYGSRDDWHILRHLVRSRVRPTRQAKIYLFFRGFVINWAKSPPHYPPRWTAPGSSSGFCSSNCWSTTTTFVGSLPLPQERKS